MARMQLTILILSILIITTSTQDICSKCACSDGNPKTVDCANKKLNTIKFNETALWKSSTNVTLDVAIFNFQNNELVHVYPFPKLEKLTKLDLSRNRIARIEPQSFKYLQNMYELDLSDNQLTSDVMDSEIFLGQYLPEDFEPLRSLKVLRLSQNAFHSLKHDLFEHVDHVEMLYLDNNPFSVIDKVTITALGDLQYLKVLDLSYASLKTLPEYMLHTPRYLEILNLTGNQIEIIPSTLGDAKNLQWLSLSNNPLQNLVDTNLFPVMNSLKTLEMSFLQNLHEIGKGAFSGLLALQELKMTDNHALCQIHPDAFSRVLENHTEWPEIHKLYLQNNNLSRLDEMLLYDWEKLEVIDLRYNPWICDCEEQFMITKLTPLIQRDNHDLLTGFVCEHPVEMKGKNFSSLHTESVIMRCLDKYGNRPEKDGSILIGMFVGIIITVPIMFALLMFCYRKNFFGLITGRGPAEYSRTFYQRTDNNDDYI